MEGGSEKMVWVVEHHRYGIVTSIDILSMHDTQQEAEEAMHLLAEKIKAVTSRGGKQPRDVDLHVASYPEWFAMEELEGD
jgi:hypothetical protein